MEKSKLTELRIEGMRSIEKVRLPLEGLTVLIGENGVGKSTIVEACELLRRLSTPNFIDAFNSHGGLNGLLRMGAPRLRLGFTWEDTSSSMDYELSFAREGGLVVIDRETLSLTTPGDARLPATIIDRTRGKARVLHEESQEMRDVPIGPENPMLSAFGLLPPHSAIPRVVRTLEAIDVHVPFDTLSGWVGRELNRQSVMRSTMLHAPAESLFRFGANLANAYSALKNDFGEAHWQETMDLVRLGLGEDLESVNIRPDPGGGSIALSFKYRGFDQQLLAFQFSDGQLSYLAFVALFRLNLQRASLFAFDEPETHLHPALLMRVLDFFETAAEERQVILATHSDRLLDGLREPAKAARLMSLGERRATRITRPDPAALEKWMQHYRGLGAVRSEGFEDSVFIPEEEP